MIAHLPHELVGARIDEPRSGRELRLDERRRRLACSHGLGAGTAASHTHGAKDTQEK
jgi:hypothetical protein